MVTLESSRRNFGLRCPMLFTMDKTPTGSNLSIPDRPWARSRRFSVSDRIQYTREFELVRKGGLKKAGRFVVANWLIKSDSDRPRLGIITSRKIGSAVERNRARRLIREAFRSCRPCFVGPADLVLIARHSIRGRSRDEVLNDLESLLISIQVMEPRKLRA
ncbi:MAG: ribonuclease P protein component [Verrucomicrobia bacterium]|nr:ribonuclease P protein component [Verrucomicrobiota bacterium]